MRAISSLFRFFAWLIMIFVVIFLPLALLGRAVGQLLFTEQGLSRALSQNLLAEDVFASIVEELVNESIASSAGDAPEEAYFSRVLSSLDHSDWVTVTSLVAPQELMRSTASDLFSGFYDWLEGETLYPNFFIDLAPWKSNIENSKIGIIEIFLDTIPNCSPTQVAEFTSGQELPFCKPPEPHYSNLLAEISSEISVALNEIPNDFSTFSDDVVFPQETLREIARAKQAMLLVRSTLRYGWMIVLILFLIAIPMGARSLQGFFYWSGIPLGLGGAGSLVLAFVVSALGGGFLSGISGPAFAELPTAVLTPMNVVITTIVAGIARPMIWQSTLLVVIGAVLTVVGMVINRLNKQHQEDFGLASTVVEKDSDDTPSPSGMFG